MANSNSSWNEEDFKNLTLDQKVEVSRILSRARLRLLGIGAKFGFGLFLANMVTIIFGIKYLQDVDVKNQVYFQWATMITNVIFMTIYLNGQLKQNSVIVKEEIEKVLKNIKS
jgi:hypothetical protein